MTYQSNSASVDIDIAACHEAGHALAALREGRGVSRVFVSRTHPGNGVCWHGRRPKNPYSIDRSPGAAKAAWHHSLETTRSDLRIALAGPMAEAKALNKPLRSLGCRSDLESCLRLAWRLSDLHSYVSQFARIPPINPNLILDRERKAVRRWLGQPGTWKTIQMLARALSRSASLPSQDLEHHIGLALAGDQQPHLCFLSAAENAGPVMVDVETPRAKGLMAKSAIESGWGMGRRAA